MRLHRAVPLAVALLVPVVDAFCPRNLARSTASPLAVSAQEGYTVSASNSQNLPLPASPLQPSMDRDYDLAIRHLARQLNRLGLAPSDAQVVEALRQAKMEEGAVESGNVQAPAQPQPVVATPPPPPPPPVVSVQPPAVAANIHAEQQAMSSLVEPPRPAVPEIGVLPTLASVKTQPRQVVRDAIHNPEPSTVASVPSDASPPTTTHDAPVTIQFRKPYRDEAETESPTKTFMLDSCGIGWQLPASMRSSFTTTPTTQSSSSSTDALTRKPKVTYDD